VQKRKGWVRKGHPPAIFAAENTAQVFAAASIAGGEQEKGRRNLPVSQKKKTSTQQGRRAAATRERGGEGKEDLKKNRTRCQHTRFVC
jgi:hypothetical protein